MPSDDRPLLLPTGSRVPAAVVAVAAAAVFAVLALRYAGDSGPSRTDGRLGRAVDALPDGGHRVARLVVLFGSPGLVAVAALGIGLGCLLCRRPRAALLAAGGPGLTGLVTTFGKPVVDRTISHGLAFPSGHTGGATSLTLVVGLLAAAALGLGPRTTAALVLPGAALAGGAVGTGMVVLGSHYPTDVVGGFCVAVAAVLGVALALDAVPARRVPAGRPGRSGPSTGRGRARAAAGAD